jgi:hypothetical protein
LNLFSFEPIKFKVSGFHHYLSSFGKLFWRSLLRCLAAILSRPEGLWQILAVGRRNSSSRILRLPETENEVRLGEVRLGEVRWGEDIVGKRFLELNGNP